jgi:ribosomal protein S27E
MKLPEWMRGQFEKGECPYCKKPLTEKGVQTHGIKEESAKSKKKTRYIHFYDYKCLKCKNRFVFSFPTTFREFIGDMMELAGLSNDGDTGEIDESDFYLPQKKKSGITDDEVSEVKRILDESDDLKDFFGKIGIPMNKPKDQPDENK